LARLIAYGDRESQGLHLRRSWGGTALLDGDGLETQGLWLRKPTFADACKVLEVALDAAVALTVAEEAVRGLALAGDAAAALAVAQAAQAAISVRDQAERTLDQAGTFPDVLLEVRMNAAADLETGEDADKSIDVPADADAGLEQKPDAKRDLKVGGDAEQAIDVEECDKK
jgi:hypothetical protein